MLKIGFDKAQSPEDVVRHLDGYRSQIPFATSLAINRTADLVRKAIVAEMKKVFDRPTPFTRNSLYVTPSTKHKLEAVVWLKDEYAVGNQGTPATRYLGPEIFGGKRSAKSTEKLLRRKGILGSNLFAVPGEDAAANDLLDRYGNMKTGIVAQLRSGLKIESELGRQANITEKSRKRRSKRDMYYVLGKDKPIGIARRKPDGGTGGGSGWSETVLWFVKAPNYKPRLDFFGIGRKVIDEHLERELVKAMRYAIKTAR